MQRGNGDASERDVAELLDGLGHTSGELRSRAAECEQKEKERALTSHLPY